MKLVTILAATLSSLVLAACSSDEPGLLPGDDAQQILANLDRVEELASNGECAAALESIETISSQITALPGSVNDRLRRNLRRGIVRLSEVTATSCGEASSGEDTTSETTIEPETVPEETEGDGPTGGTGGDQTGADETDDNNSRGNGRGNGGRSDLTPDNPGRGNTNPPPRGDGGGGSGEQPQPNPGGGGETPSGDDTDSGGISPDASGSGEPTP